MSQAVLCMGFPHSHCKQVCQELHVRVKPAGLGCVTPALGQTVTDALSSFLLLQNLKANKEAESDMAFVNAVLEAQGMMLFLLPMCNVLASHQERTW